MAIDFATLSVTVKQDDVPKAVDNLDKLTAAGTKAEAATNRLGASSVAATRNMSAWSAIQAEAAGHVGEHSLNISRLERALGSVAEKATGLNSTLGLLGSSFLKFGAGDIYTVAIVGGIAAISATVEKLTEDSRKAMDVADKLAESYNRAARVNALGIGGKEKADLEDINKGLEQHIKWLSALIAIRERLGPLGGLVWGITGQSNAIGLNTSAAKQAEQDAINARGLQDAKDNQAWADRIAKEKREADERARKAQEAIIRESDLVRFYGAAGQPMSRADRGEWLGARDRDSAKYGTMSDTQQAELNKQLGFEFKAPSISMPNMSGIAEHLLGGGNLTPLQRATERLIVSFNVLADAHLKFVESLASAHQKFADVREAFNRGNIIPGINAGAEGGIADALSQFTPEALTYKAVTSGLNFIVSGFADMAAAMFDGGAGARAFALAMKTQRDEYTAAIAQFKHDNLAAALASNVVAADQLLKQLQDSVHFADVLKDPAAAAHKLQQGPADIAAQEAKNAAIIQRQAGYSLEDLAVRNMKALGQTDAAGLLAFKESQQREMQAAIDANKDATYINTLATTQNNELIAYQNGLLSTAIRNSPTGFYGAAAYFGQYATPRSSDPFSTGVVPPNSPVNPTGGLTPPGGTGDTSRRPVPTRTIVLTVDGRVLTSVVVKNLDQSAAATNGAGSSRSAALDNYTNN